ncbi:MAG: hypothetical protein AAGI89_14695 [Pseudomonadota bacterium]
MAYGDNRRVSVDRNFGIFSISALGFAAALGIGAAVIVDLLQQREASALFVINRWILDLTSLLRVSDVPLYGVMLILMAIGGSSVMFLQPVTFRGAFGQGFGLLAALVTIAPSDLGSPLAGPDTVMFEPSSATLEPASLSAAAVQRHEDHYDLRIQVVFPDGLQDDVYTMIRRNRLAGRIYDTTSGVSYNLFRNSGAQLDYEDGVLRIEAQIRGSADRTQLKARIEADGYRIEEGSFTAREGANPVWTIRMKPTNQPLFVLRLRHSYSF